ncbi:hypothetical protein TEA_028231 [Camellia sinensis var. sinensis]|uniref:EF-hand domain-containing protein n=1 Tax=Camellia sinensis var. sinensis TaxID=542762 RepID=A0A4S4DNG5_CAMSN|nr:hypothetical protein TEA_028231 [Camellia sinensis var. sinensis]
MNWVISLLCQTFDLSSSEAVDFQDTFLSMNPNSSGQVRIHDFFRLLRLKACNLSEKIFGVLDVEKKGKITFKQVIISLLVMHAIPNRSQLCLHKANTELLIDGKSIACSSCDNLSLSYACDPQSVPTLSAQSQYGASHRWEIYCLQFLFVVDAMQLQDLDLLLPDLDLLPLPGVRFVLFVADLGRADEEKDGEAVILYSVVNKVIVFNVAFVAELKIQICRRCYATAISRSVASRSRSTTTTGCEICALCC